MEEKKNRTGQLEKLKKKKTNEIKNFLNKTFEKTKAIINSFEEIRKKIDLINLKNEIFTFPFFFSHFQKEMEIFQCNNLGSTKSYTFC